MTSPTYLSTTSGSASSSQENSPCGSYVPKHIDIEAIDSCVRCVLFESDESPSSSSPESKEPFEQTEDLLTQSSIRKFIFIYPPPITNPLERSLRNNGDRLLPRSSIADSPAPASYEQELARALGISPDPTPRITQAATGALQSTHRHAPRRTGKLSATVLIPLHIR